MIAFRKAAGSVLVLVAASSPAWGAGPQNCPQSVDVRDLMTVTQFTSAGLDKLTKQQLAALNAWLSEYLAGICSPPPSAPQKALPSSSTVSASPLSEGGKAAAGHQAQPSTSSGAAVAAFGAPPEQPPPSTPNQIESRIVGDFHGWTGDTIFRLENGQVWKQAGPGYFETNLKNPKVEIKKLMIGYVLIVDGYSKEVFVRRIR